MAVFRPQYKGKNDRGAQAHSALVVQFLFPGRPIKESGQDHIEGGREGNREKAPVIDDN